MTSPHQQFIQALQGNRRCAAIYVRVSTEEQATEGVSLDEQVSRSRAYCDLHQLDVAALFRDEGVSAGKPLRDRPNGRELLNAVAEGRVSHVVTVKLDRLFRDAVGLSPYQYLDQLRVAHACELLADGASASSSHACATRN